MFFVVFDHVNACVSMRLLVEIHNKYFFKKYTLYPSTKENCCQTPIEGPCRGTITFGAMEIEDGKEPPLYLVARNQRVLNGPEAFLNVPKEINVSGQPNQLGVLPHPPRTPHVEAWSKIISCIYFLTSNFKSKPNFDSKPSTKPSTKDEKDDLYYRNLKDNIWHF